MTSGRTSGPKDRTPGLPGSDKNGAAVNREGGFKNDDQIYLRFKNVEQIYLRFKNVDQINLRFKNVDQIYLR